MSPGTLVQELTIDTLTAAPPTPSSATWSRLWSVPILAYHRVGEPRRDHVPTVTPEAFDAQLRWMRRLGYRTIDLTQLSSLVAAGQSISRRTTVITFDDGYEETATAVLPLLRRHGFCATIFVTPMEVNTSGFLNWQQVRELAEAGMSIGSHTMHHTYLPLVSLKRAGQELRDSKDALEQRVQRPIEWLSYPIGGYTRPIQELVRESGYRGACTTNRGTSPMPDMLALRRIKMTDRDRHPVALWAKLSGFYDAFRRSEAPA